MICQHYGIIVGIFIEYEKDNGTIYIPDNNTIILYERTGRRK